MECSHYVNDRIVKRFSQNTTTTNTASKEIILDRFGRMRETDI